MQCVGTSATMTTGGEDGPEASRRRRSDDLVRRACPGRPGDRRTLERATDPAALTTRRRAADQRSHATRRLTAFMTDPLATWVEEAFGFEPDHCPPTRAAAGGR